MTLYNSVKAGSKWDSQGTHGRNRCYMGLVAALILVTAAQSVCFGRYGGGSGTEADPYLISNASHLTEMGSCPEDYHRHFRQTADIDLQGMCYESAVIAPDANSLTYEFEGIAFAGVYDGSKHRIANLVINGEGGYFGYIGLFGKLAHGAVIRNIRMEDVSIRCEDVHWYSENIAALCGQCGDGRPVDYDASLNDYVYNLTLDTLIEGCQVSGKIVCEGRVGGVGLLCGSNYRGEIRGCRVDGNLRIREACIFVGGLCGDNMGVIRDCSASCSLTLAEMYECRNVGGLCGRNDYWIDKSYASGSIVAEGNGEFEYIGGLCGFNWCYSSDILRGNLGRISRSYATGSLHVTGLQAYRRIGGSLAGLCGCNRGAIDQCHSTGDVVHSDLGYGCTAGFVGINGGLVEASYSTGHVAGGYYSGGLAAVNYSGIVLNCYSHGSVSGCSSVGGLIGVAYDGSVTDCYSTGQVNGFDDKTFVGGLCGTLEGQVLISGCAWDIDICSLVAGCNRTSFSRIPPFWFIACTADEMRRKSTFSEWDFVNTWAIGENQTYPYLRTTPAGDVNNDQTVNLLDFALLAEQYRN